MDAQFTELKGLIVGLHQHVDVRLSEFDARFDRIDGRLSEFDARFNEIDRRLSEFDVRFNEIDERDRLLRDYIDERFTQMHDYVDERTRDMETRMLKGFQKWATSIELTVKPMPIRIGSIEERLALLEERWKDIDNQGA